jgi:hypothetical protein
VSERQVNERLEAPPIQPVHWQTAPNASIALGTFQASFSGKSNNRTDVVSGEAHLRFAPKEKLQLVIPAPPQKTLARKFFRALTETGGKQVRLRLRNYGTDFDVFCTSLSSDQDIFTPTQIPMQVFKPVDTITHAIFHLLNWPEFRGPENYVLMSGVPPLQGATNCGRFTLYVDGWTITVAATGQTKDAIKAIGEAGGACITHVGQIQRPDLKPFSTSQLFEVLTTLQYFFSFMLGRWSSPSLTVGFNSSRERVYEEWGTRRCADGNWSGAQSCFDVHHADMFAAVAPGFWKVWSSKVWRRPLTETIYWYLNANRGGSGLGVDAALLFTQAALELLSWTHCVIDRKMVSADAFKPRGLSAADKLRLLISSLGIPMEIPQSLSSLHAKRGKKWEDSMDAITELRNGLVHPGSDKEFPEGAFYDAWRLSMWYLDLVLLRLCSYGGEYANRIRERYVGQVEPVPWTP